VKPSRKEREVRGGKKSLGVKKTRLSGGITGSWSLKTLGERQKTLNWPSFSVLAGLKKSKAGLGGGGHSYLLSALEKKMGIRGARKRAATGCEQAAKTNPIERRSENKAAEKKKPTKA